MIKRLLPIDIRVGDEIYCGYTGKKNWKTVRAIEVVSAWRYTLRFEDWGISAGSACEYMVRKKPRKPHGF